jgi:uncharacterized repeat protein (TIGR03803 family)
MSGGTASITTSELPVGTNSITAVYSGDSNFSGSSNTVEQVVNPAAAKAYTYSVLYSFTGAPDGAVPSDATLVRDAQGNLYGTTFSGGDASCGGYYGKGCGTVFKVDATGKETLLYSFTGTWVGSVNVGDGAVPSGGALVRDAQGNLYGTTSMGGTYGAGTVFKLDTTGKETVLYSFNPPAGDGSQPYAGLVRDAQGNLYGTTFDGGDPTCAYFSGCGTVFKVDATGKETVLYKFTGTDGDGGNPWAGLVLDPQGDLYGTTFMGGDLACNAPYGCGTVFKLDITGKETVLYRFAGDDGEAPRAGSLVPDSAGNLYDTTSTGGVSGEGTVFKLDTTGKETLLYSFGENGSGWAPYGGLVRDAQGNLYGPTFGGGSGRACGHGCGTLYELDANGNETVLYNFTGGADGAYPGGGLVRDAQGNLYGTTRGVDWVQGGASGEGTVFMLRRLPATTNTLTSSRNPSVYGEEVTFTAEVTSSDGAPPDGETVSFLNGTTTLGAGTLSGGTASFATTALPSGTDFITAVYGGDSNFADSMSSAVRQVVKPVHAVP